MPRTWGAGMAHHAPFFCTTIPAASSMIAGVSTWSSPVALLSVDAGRGTAGSGRHKISPGTGRHDPCRDLRGERLVELVRDDIRGPAPVLRDPCRKCGHIRQPGLRTECPRCQFQPFYHSRDLITHKHLKSNDESATAARHLRAAVHQRPLPSRSSANVRPCRCVRPLHAAGGRRSPLRLRFGQPRDPDRGLGRRGRHLPPGALGTLPQAFRRDLQTDGRHVRPVRDDR